VLYEWVGVSHCEMLMYSPVYGTVQWATASSSDTRFIWTEINYYEIFDVLLIFFSWSEVKMFALKKNHSS